MHFDISKKEADFWGDCFKKEVNWLMQVIGSETLTWGGGGFRIFKIEGGWDGVRGLEKALIAAFAARLITWGMHQEKKLGNSMGVP